MTTITRRLDVTEQQIAALALDWVASIAGVRLSGDELSEVGRLKMVVEPTYGTLAECLREFQSQLKKAEANRE